MARLQCDTPLVLVGREGGREEEEGVCLCVGVHHLKMLVRSFLCFIFVCPKQGLATSSMEMVFVYLVLEGISHMVI